MSEASGATEIGRYRMRIEADRLQVRRHPGLLARLGLRENRPILSVLGIGQVGGVETSRRRLRALDLKRPRSARAWEVRVLGPDRRPLCRAFRFRSSEEAERFSELVRRFAAGARA